MTNPVHGRKAQLEMLGIAVVVVLILVGFMLALVLMQPSDTASIALDVARTEIGANTINTLMKTTTPCKRLTVAELITDCIDFNDIDCAGMDSCEYAHSVIQTVLKDTLTKWGYDYMFSVSAEGLEQGTTGDSFDSTAVISRKCTEFDHFEQIIPAPLRLIKLNLDICR